MCQCVSMCSGSPSVCTWCVFLSLSGSDSYLSGPEATGIIRHTFIRAGRRQHGRLTVGLWSPYKPPSPGSHFVLKTVQYWLHSTEHTSDKVSMVTVPWCGCLWSSASLQSHGVPYLLLSEGLTYPLNTLQLDKTFRRRWQVWFCMAVMPTLWQVAN